LRRLISLPKDRAAHERFLPGKAGLAGLVLSAALQTGMAQPAHGQIPQPTLNPAAVQLAGREIRFSGLIDNRAVDRLEMLLRSGPGRRVTQLRIESAGGDGFAGLRLGRLLHDRRLTLHVGRVCASACAVYALPAARTVILDGDSIILMHQFASPLMARLIARGLEIGHFDPARRQRWEARQLEVTRLIEAQGPFYRSLGLDPERMNRIMIVYADLSRRVTPMNLGDDVPFVPDADFLRDCLGLTNGPWRSHTASDSEETRIGGLPVGYLIGGQLYFGGRALPGPSFACPPAAAR
jgi:hypothetical protein